MSISLSPKDERLLFLSRAPERDISILILARGDTRYNENKQARLVQLCFSGAKTGASVRYRKHPSLALSEEGWVSHESANQSGVPWRADRRRGPVAAGVRRHRGAIAARARERRGRTDAHAAPDPTLAAHSHAG